MIVYNSSDVCLSVAVRFHNFEPDSIQTFWNHHGYSWTCCPQYFVKVTCFLFYSSK